MGRRKWKQYQETLMRTHLNSDQFVASIEDNNIELKKELDKLENGDIKDTSYYKPSIIANSNLEENHRKENNQQQDKQQQHHTTTIQKDEVKDIKQEEYKEPPINKGINENYT